MKRIVFYTREGCCLCQDALTIVQRVQSRHPQAFVVELRDIDEDHSLLMRYLERIPVLEVDGEEAFELFVDESELERRLGIVEAR